MIENKLKNMSNHEINLAVAKELYGASKVDENGTISRWVGVRKTEDEEYEEFNPCENGNDTMFILTEYKVGISWIIDGTAMAVIDYGYDQMEIATNKNVNRAICEVFLMFKENA